MECWQKSPANPPWHITTDLTHGGHEGTLSQEGRNPVCVLEAKFGSPCLVNELGSEHPRILPWILKERCSWVPLTLLEEYHKKALCLAHLAFAPYTCGLWCGELEAVVLPCL